MEVKYIDHMGTDLSVVNAARVSFGKKSEFKYCSGFEGQYCDDRCGVEGLTCPDLFDKDKKLIKYLATHGHFSPFNHTNICLHAKAPVFVARQLVKHKFMPWNEISRRYVDDEPEFYYPESWRARAENKKQGSDERKRVDSPSIWTEHQELLDQTTDFYKWLLECGAAPEQARMVLPLNTYTEWYWSGTLGAWSSMYNLRSKPDTQWETQQIANMCGEIIKPLFPYSWEALTNNYG